MTPHIPSSTKASILVPASQQGSQEEGTVFDTSDGSESDRSESGNEGAGEEDESEDEDLAAEEQLIVSQLSSQNPIDDDGDTSNSDSEEGSDTDTVDLPNVPSPPCLRQT
jgi:hypothetical protein